MAGVAQLADIDKLGCLNGNFRHWRVSTRPYADNLRIPGESLTMQISISNLIHQNESHKRIRPIKACQVRILSETKRPEACT